MSDNEYSDVSFYDVLNVNSNFRSILKKAAIHRQMLDHLMIQKGTLERRFAQI
jgi:hypothetical protein